MQSLQSHQQLHKKLLRSLQAVLKRQMLSISHRLAGTAAGAASHCLSACRAEQEVATVQLLHNRPR